MFDVLEDLEDAVGKLLASDPNASSSPDFELSLSALLARIRAEVRATGSKTPIAAETAAAFSTGEMTAEHVHTIAACYTPKRAEMLEGIEAETRPNARQCRHRREADRRLES
jgi:hypothetical protein